MAVGSDPAVPGARNSMILMRSWVAAVKPAAEAMIATAGWAPAITVRTPLAAPVKAADSSAQASHKPRVVVVFTRSLSWGMKQSPSRTGGPRRWCVAVMSADLPTNR